MLLSINCLTYAYHSYNCNIDNIFINNAISSTSRLIYADISDHLPIFAALEKFELALNKPHDNNDALNYISRNFNKENFKKFSSQLCNCSWDFITDHSNVNHSYTMFLTQFLNKMCICFPEIPQRNKRKKIKPCMIKKLKLKFNKSFPYEPVNNTIKKRLWLTPGILKSSKTKNKL